METLVLIQIIGIVLIVLFIIGFLQCNHFNIGNPCAVSSIEHYEERIRGSEGSKDDTPDIYDSQFADIYELIYRDLTDVKILGETMRKKTLDNLADVSDVNIMVGGCGVNKLGSYLKKTYNNVICVDNSANMLMKAQKIHPECKYIHGDLREKGLFKKGEFSHIVLDERLLNHHSKNEMEKIIENCNYWLAEQGFLITPIYHNGKLGVASRYYSTNYLDDKGNLHGFTYFNDFSHDCYYIKDEAMKATDKVDNNKYSYFDKIILDNGQKRIKKTDFYFYPKEDMYSMIVRKYFKLFYTEEYVPGKQVIAGYDVGVFRKERSKMTVDEIQKKYD
jgi:hypothetical protein